VGDEGTGNVGPGLANFGRHVESVAEQHHAVVVYAGGDDVLALAPVSGGLGLADDLAKSYRDCLALLCSSCRCATRLSWQNSWLR
jgi:hypothetical protein